MIESAVGFSLFLQSLHFNNVHSVCTVYVPPYARIRSIRKGQFSLRGVRNSGSSDDHEPVKWILTGFRTAATDHGDRRHRRRFPSDPVVNYTAARNGVSSFGTAAASTNRTGRYLPLFTLFLPAGHDRAKCKLSGPDRSRGAGRLTAALLPV